jgi:hypothetical protein
VLIAASLVLAAVVRVLQPRMTGPAIWQGEDNDPVGWTAALVSAIHPKDSAQIAQVTPMVAVLVDSRGASVDSVRRAINALLDSAQRVRFDAEWQRVQQRAARTIPVPPIAPPSSRSR